MKLASIEEKKEEERHNRYYINNEESDLFIEAKHYEKFAKINKDLHCYTYAMRNLGDVSGKKILDLGCGTGISTVIIAKLGAQVEGIDISDEAINIAKKRAKINNVIDTAIFKKMSFYDLEYPNNYFDKIIGFSVLHHSHQKQALGEALYKVLKPGGTIIFNEPFGNSKALEKLRLLVPIRVQEEDKTHWNEQIKYGDLEYFKEKFIVRYREFQLFSRLDRVIKQENTVQLIGKLDVFLLEKFYWLRPYARDIVIILQKK